MVQPDNFSLYQPLVAGALWMARPRAARLSRARSSLAGLLAGLATLSPERRPARPGRARARRSLWDRWRAWRSAGGARARPIPIWAAVGCVGAVRRSSWRRGGRASSSVFGSLSPSTASGKVLFIRDIGEWNSITTPATLDHLLGMGIGPLIAQPDRRAGRRDRDLHDAGRRVRPRAVHADRRLGAPALRRLRAVLRLRRDPVRVLGHRLGRPRARAARSSTRRSRSRPYAYILALEGIVAAVAWIAAPPARAGTRTGARGSSSARAIGFAVLCAVAGSLVVHAAWAGRRTRFEPSPTALDAAGAPPDRPGHVDRRVGHQVLDRATAASSSSTTRSTRSRRSPAPTTSAGSSSSATTAVAGGRPDPRRASDPPGSAPPVIDPAANPVPGARRATRCHAAAAVVTRREAVLSALRVFAVALVVRAVFASLDRLPEARGHRLLRRRRPQPRRGPRPRRPTRCGATRRRRSSFPRPAFEVWLPLPTLPRRDPDGGRAASTLRARRSGRRSSSARSSRSSPGGSPRTSPRSAACRRPGADARDRERA